VVDQGVDTRVHPAFLVARENGNHREPEEAVLQPAQGEEQDLRAGRGRSPPRPGKPNAKGLGLTDQEVVDMNRRLGGDASLNAPIRDDGEAGEWQDWLVDNSPNQEAVMAEHEEFDHRRQALNGAIGVLNPRERRIFEARRLAEDPMTLED